MWISQWKYDRLLDRLDQLERRVQLNGYWPVVRIVELILDHLDLKITQTPPSSIVLTKDKK